MIIHYTETSSNYCYIDYFLYLHAKIVEPNRKVDKPCFTFYFCKIRTCLYIRSKNALSEIEVFCILYILFLFRYLNMLNVYSSTLITK